LKKNQTFKIKADGHHANSHNGCFMECPLPGAEQTSLGRRLISANDPRDRAIALRWVLRDIKGKRLKWSPVSQDDLQTLTQFGLVEMQNDVPVLTKTGVSAIA
jgi:hypothetical protein